MFVIDKEDRLRDMCAGDVRGEAACGETTAVPDAQSIAGGAG